MIVPLNFERLTKGQFDSVEPGDVPSGGWARAVNFVPFNKRMNRRGGSDNFTLDAKSSVADLVSVIPVSDIANAAAGIDEWALCTITREGEVEFANEWGSWQGLVPSGSGANVPDDEMPWRMIVRNNRIYALRRDGGRMRRIEGDAWRDAGRPAPLLQPTLTSPVDGASTLPAGTYQVAYGYYDSATGYYGNPGPTDEVVVASGDKITAANLIGKTTAYFATHIAVWCSQVGGQALFLAGTVACPSAPATTSYDILTVPVGQAAPSRNLQPDNACTWMEEWGERMWWANGSRLHYSPIGEFESYSDIQGIDFEIGSGSDISVIYSWGRKLVVGKRRKMFVMAGFDRSSWEKRPWSTKIGCVAPHSMRNCEGALIFKCEDGFAMSKDGEEPKVISTDSVGAILSQLDNSREDLTYAEVFPKQSLYVAVFPLYSTSTWGGVVYNWKQDAWAEFTMPQQPRSLRLGYGSGGETVLFACMNSDSQIYKIFEGDTDNGAVINAYLLSGAPKLTEEVGQLAAIKSVLALTSKTRWPLTVSIFGDGNTATAITSREIRTEDAESWKRFNVSNLGDPRLQLQVKFEYEGKDPFWIAEMSWRVMPTGKHLENY
jgi:hypothetical protein